MRKSTSPRRAATVGASAAPPSAAPARTETAAEPATGSGSGSTWILVTGIVVALIATVGAVFAARRRSG